MTTQDDSEVRQLSLYVEGMRCRRCVREVTARLRDVLGVVTVAADPRQAVVRLDGRMRVADVMAAFRGTTYRPRELPGRQRWDSGPTAPPDTVLSDRRPADRHPTKGTS